MTFDIVATPDTLGEIRLDSRALADHMGNQHASIMRLLTENQGHFAGFGQFGFEIETVTNSVGAKNQTRFALLNEDQCYFLLTLVRNSEVTVPMKAAVVAAFAKARQLLTQPATQPAAPALISARGVAAALGCSRNSALNRLSHANIRATHHYLENRQGQPALLYPLELAQARWPAAVFSEVHQGEAFPGVAPVAQAVTASKSGKIARKHHPRLIPTDNSVEQLARRLLSLEAQKKVVLKELAALGGL